MKKANIIVGLNYGDEGKGLVTDYLCISSKRPIVIRYNGGQQAGHTVVTGSGERHVFSNLGSGSLRSIPTYWSSYCTFSPGYFLEEYETLKTKPQFFLNPLCPITTHYDVLYNRALELKRADSKYGSCGVGFGATIDRQNLLSTKLLVKDLLNPNTLNRKLNLIKLFYKDKIDLETDFNFNQFDHDNEDNEFKLRVDELKKLIANKKVVIITEKTFFKKHQKDWDTLIFEGAQGILLDKEFGNKPYITKSNTTSKNAIEIINKYTDIDESNIELFYVTRAYLTRHGSGPFRKTDKCLKLKNMESETNIYNEYQGEFKINLLNIDSINYAINCDNKFSNGIIKNIVVTCVDHIATSYLPVILNGKSKQIELSNLLKFVTQKFKKEIFSSSNCAENLKPLCEFSD